MRQRVSSVCRHCFHLFQLESSIAAEAVSTPFPADLPCKSLSCLAYWRQPDASVCSGSQGTVLTHTDRCRTAPNSCSRGTERWQTTTVCYRNHLDFVGPLKRTRLHGSPSNKWGPLPRSCGVRKSCRKTETDTKAGVVVHACQLSICVVEAVGLGLGSAWAT